MPAAPVFEIDLEAFWRDPYPILARMQKDAPVAYVPQLDGIVLTRRDDIDQWEKRIDVFSSEQPGGLMTRLMGQNMMRCDGEAHQMQRRHLQPSLSPRTVARLWKDAFRSAAQDILLDLKPHRRADLCTDYAMRLSGEALRLITGLSNVSAIEMDAYSQAMIDGISNYAGDPQTESRCRQATACLDDAIDDRLQAFSNSPPENGSLEASSVIYVLAEAGVSLDQIRANVKLVISGGQNEPRDAIAGAIWALLSHPDQLAMVMDGTASWDQVFSEYVRWMAPIGMSPRRIAKDANVAGFDVCAGGRAFFMFGAANRDPAHFDHSDEFQITRDTRKHIAFGAGPHFCAGAFASRALVADVALPMIFGSLNGLRLDPVQEVLLRGWAFRGPLAVKVLWN